MHVFTRWDELCSTDQTNDIAKELAFWHLGEAKPSEDRRIITGKILCGDFAGLCAYELDVSRHSPEDAYHLGQSLAFYSKRQDLDLGIDRKSVAYEKFLAAEQTCREMNHIFKLWSKGEFHFTSAVERQLFAAQRKISMVLGDVPNLSDLRLRFGPGATTQVTKIAASARRKLGERFACSEDLIPLLPKVLDEMPAWAAGVFLTGDVERALVPVDIVPGRLSFVPKSAKTDRSIVVEPMLNSMVQLGICDYISRQLRRVGVDIRDQTRNQKMARRGSVNGDLATLDLSSASDTISLGVVEHLLPPEWYDFLLLCRTSTVEHEGSLLKLQKFSSMGNGFTFPLETLIFWALACSVCNSDELKDVSVYGDDIIVPTRAYEPLCTLLNACGFSVNAEKSFSSGPFRESCGKDYLLGIDIRPVFIRDRLSGADLFVLHNYYVRRKLPLPAALIVQHIAPHVQLWGPDAYGDGHLIDDQCSHLRPHNRGLGWAGYTFETYSWKGRKCFRPSPGDYVYPLYTVYMGQMQNPFEDVHFALLGQVKVPEFNTFRVELLQSMDAFMGRTPVAVYQKRREGVVLGTTVPGTRGYKRVKIYTLQC